MNLKMVKLFLSVILFVAFLNVNAQDTKTQTRQVGPFNEVHAGKGINVTLIQGDKESLKIEIENADPTDVITQLKGRKLNIKLKTKIFKDMSVMVYVTYKDILSIDASSGAFIQSDGVITAENLELNAGTGSSIVLEIDTKNVSSSLSSSKIELVGKTDFQKVSANTGAKYIADHLESKEAYAKSYTGANVWLTASKKLDAKANTTGKITYVGNPEILETQGNVHRE